MKEAYVDDINFRHHRLRDLIDVCDGIVEEFVAQGFRLTVRQIYYQLVARGKIPNTMKSYDSIQNLLNRARLAGLIDWDAIEDRTREVVQRPRWRSGGHILESVAEQYHQDMWHDQEYRPFVIVEKEALAGVFSGICHGYDVPLLAARGYPSASVLRDIGKNKLLDFQEIVTKRGKQRLSQEQTYIFLHFGDHDPSGIDMSRDLQDRLTMFGRDAFFEFRRLALNMDQIRELQPPPNPAKVTDSRYEDYVKKFGTESWELDALTPQYLHKLIHDEMKTLINAGRWKATERRIKRVKARLEKIATEFDK